METNHTPGPWHACRTFPCAIYDKGEILVAFCEGTDGLSERYANANLIAAAPENYQSNRELAAVVRELCTAYGHPLPEASLARSDAAIAKALGKE